MTEEIKFINAQEAARCTMTLFKTLEVKNYPQGLAIIKRISVLALDEFESIADIGAFFGTALTALEDYLENNGKKFWNKEREHSTDYDKKKRAKKED